MFQDADSLWRKFTSGQPQQPGKNNSYSSHSEAEPWGFFALWFAINAATLGKNKETINTPGVLIQLLPDKYVLLVTPQRSMR